MINIIGGMELWRLKQMSGLKTLIIDDYVISVNLMDGRSVSVPLIWYPRLANASQKARGNWQTSGGGYGIHWPGIDEDLSTEGLLRGLRHRCIRRKTKRSGRVGNRITCKKPGTH